MIRNSGTRGSGGYTILPLAVLLLLLSVPGCSRETPDGSPNAPPFGVVDRPRAREQVGRVVDVSGWALDDRAVDSVQIHVDGQLKETVDVNIPRPDVTAAFPQFAEAAAARGHRHGWTARVDVGPEPGPHQIKVLAVDDEGAIAEVASAVVVLIGRE